MHLESLVESPPTSEARYLKNKVQIRVMEAVGFLAEGITEHEIKHAFQRWILKGYAERFSEAYEKLLLAGVQEEARLVTEVTAALIHTSHAPIE